MSFWENRRICSIRFRADTSLRQYDKVAMEQKKLPKKSWGVFTNYLLLFSIPIYYKLLQHCDKEILQVQSLLLELIEFEVRHEVAWNIALCPTDFEIESFIFSKLPSKVRIGHAEFMDFVLEFWMTREKRMMFELHTICIYDIKWRYYSHFLGWMQEKRIDFLDFLEKRIV